MKPNQPIIFLIDLVLTCTIVFSQVNSASKPTYTEIASAALKSDRDYTATWHGTKPPGWEYGEYEIPSQYWTGAIKELKPVKLYDHVLNVAIVLNVKDGVEEGIYVGNIISSHVVMPGIIDPDGFEFSEDGRAFRRNTKPPRFEDYPVADQFTGTPVSPKIGAFSELDLEKIRNGVEKGLGVFHGEAEQKGVNFAGQFILIKWSCGSSCLAMAVVDAKTGDIHLPPDKSINCSTTPNCNCFDLSNYSGQIQFRPDSNLLIVKRYAGIPGGPFMDYILWKGNRWTLIRRMPTER
jgi:hypothetical protein